jgi:hypothetical protein
VDVYRSAEFFFGFELVLFALEIPTNDDSEPQRPC